MSKLLIGADPELFLIDKDGNFKSAHNVIPGSKIKPTGVLNGAIQPDGVAAEFNIEPASTKEEFADHIRDVLREMQSRVEQKGFRLFVQPTAFFDKKYFNRLPKKAKLLGCEPDFNAWEDGQQNPSPSTKEPFRTGAGHIHVGWTKEQSPNDSAHVFDCIEATKQLDAGLYFCSLLWDNDDKRRSLYGKIGTYRAKHYGVEYRPLSNAWVADPDLHLWVFEATRHLMELLDSDQKVYKDYFAMDMLIEARAGRTQPRLALLEYYDHLVDSYGMPKLPPAYTRASN